MTPCGVEDVRKGSIPSLLVGVKTWASTLEINLVVSQKFGNSSMLWPSYTTPGHIPQNIPPFHNDTCSMVFIGGALFLIVRNWKQPRCHSTEEWIKNYGYLQNEILHNHQKQGHYEFCRQLDETRMYHPEWDNPDIRIYMACTLISGYYL